MSTESTEIPSIASFNQTGVMAQLGMPQNDDVLQSCVRFTFDGMMQDNAAMPGAAARRTESVKESLEHLKLRYELFTQYAADFFRDQPYDREAVLIALLGGGDIYTANEDGFTPFDMSFDAFADDEDRNALKRAQNIHNAATEISIIQPEGVETDIPSRESLFIAHANVAIHDDARLKIALHDDDDVELQNFLENDLPAIEHFADPSTQLGEDTLEIAASWENTIKEQLGIGQPHTVSSLDAFVTDGAISGPPANNA